MQVIFVPYFPLHTLIITKSINDVGGVLLWVNSVCWDANNDDVSCHLDEFAQYSGPQFQSVHR